MVDLQQVVSCAADHIHRNSDRVTAARELCTSLELETEIPDDSTAVAVLWTVVKLFLDRDLYEYAAALLWSEQLFSPKPAATKLVWDTIRTSNTFLLMGAASMSKSYSAGVYLFLDWLRDPEWTTIKVVGPSEKHLEENLFSHLVRLHQSSALPMPGTVGQLFIGLDPRDRVSSISGVVISIGKKASGKLQGGKRVPRKGPPHPVFGATSRVRIFLDESENIPLGVWADVDNVLALSSKDGGFKLGGAFNPKDRSSQTALRCEPIGGWEAGFDIDTSERWVSKRGWDICRLDSMRCENVVQRQVVYPGMQTLEGVQKIIQNSGGYNTPGYYSMVRACYPPQGTNFSVVPANLLADAVADFLFVGKPENILGFDAALEGGDTAVPSIGRYGLAIGWKDREGRTTMFREKPDGPVQARYAIQLDRQLTLPPAPTVTMGEAVKDVAVKSSVRPWWVCCDRTGNGAGVHDWLKHYWAPEVRGVNFSESPTGRKIMEEDATTTEEEYDKIVSELWFVLRSFLEFGVLKLAVGTDWDQLLKELGGRLYLSAGKKRKVEGKLEYKSRGNPSPDKADSLALMVHAVRLQASLVPSMKGGAAGASADVEDDEGVKPFVGATDRLDDLETASTGGSDDLY